MKKRMFLSTILMTLVLLVAVTTATFAWYQASARATHTPKTSSQIDTLTSYSIDAAGLDGEFSMPVQVALSNSAGASYHLVGTTPVLDESAVVQSTGTYTLSWKAGVTDEQKAAAEGTYTLTLTPAGYALVAKTGNAYASSTTTPITFTVVISADGKFAVDGGAAAATAVCNFVYAVRSINTETTGSGATPDTTDAHLGDKITASWA